MKEKIFNLPNSITLFRIIVLIPLSAYFFLSKQNIAALFSCLVFAILDGLDGFLARKNKMVTKTGLNMDAIGDHLFLLVIVIIFLYFGYINWTIFALFAAHRLTRLFLTLFILFHAKGFFIPVFLKFLAVVVFIYMFFVPLISSFLGQEITNTISIFIIYATYFPLLMTIQKSLKLYRQGGLKIMKF